MKKMTDEQLLKRVLFDKERYSIVVDNDVVWVQDNEKNSNDDDFWTGFNEYGYELIPTIFEVIGVKAEFV
ncbi:hypothetical protein [Paenibacillus sp. FSL H3-0333]|uniref:hypothetical protein n=1 Tax=Paenibacillus sp. FSL H3-0333 TaxID=2921373 RepID=UPI0030F50BD7